MNTESSLVYKKGVSPRGVPDAVTPKRHRISHLDSVYARAAERVGIYSPQAATICQSKLH
ncbi:hypothetical protein [uncultured Helicobacter sp.]|uniref:hypothetical protein n=1 Tax=uncultured Helicobacter sp. TaxID=175537 RepID=UPI003750FA96